MLVLYSLPGGTCLRGRAFDVPSKGCAASTSDAREFENHAGLADGPDHHFGPPLAEAYVRDLKDAAVSVVWKGSVDAFRLRNFFVDAAKTVCSNGLPYYRTRVLKPTARAMEEAWDEPPLEKLGDDVRFVRFECIPAARRDLKEVKRRISRAHRLGYSGRTRG